MPEKFRRGLGELTNGPRNLRRSWLILVSRISAYGTASSSLVGGFISASSLELVILASQASVRPARPSPLHGGPDPPWTRARALRLLPVPHRCHSLSLS